MIWVTELTNELSGRAEVAHYAALAGAASASVKIIFDVLRAWRTTGHPAHNQSQVSAFEIIDAVIEDASDWGDGPSRHLDSTELLWGELSSSAIIF